MPKMKHTLSRHVPLWIDLVVRLFPFAEYADSIVRSASRTRVGAITFGLLHTAPVASFADSFPERVGRLLWTGPCWCRHSGRWWHGNRCETTMGTKYRWSRRKRTRFEDDCGCFCDPRI